MDGVEEHCRLTLEVTFWVEFPPEAACIGFAAGNLVRQNIAGAGWVFLPLPSTFETALRPLCFPVWHHWPWKGKLKSLWVQKRMEESPPSPDLTPPKGPRGPPGAGNSGNSSGRNCPYSALEFPSQHLSSACFISLHAHSFPSPAFSSWAAWLLPHLDASLSLLIVILHPSP